MIDTATTRTGKDRVRHETMTPRQIHSLMRRLCYFGVAAADGYRHLARAGGLDRELVQQLIDDYVVTDDVIVYADAFHCAHVPKSAAFGLILEYRSIDARSRIRVVADDFSAHIVVEPIDVGVGEQRRKPSP